MPLTIADIERWDPLAVREVFHAATARGATALDVADGLGRLPAFQTWGGTAADAARDAIGRTRVDLDAHGNEALAVAKAADIAAADIERIKDQLERVKEAAHNAHLKIDPLTGQVLPGPGYDARNPFNVMAEIELQAAVDGLIADANRVDAELATAIQMADGQISIPATPPGNSLSDQQIGDMVAEMVDGQDLDGSEAQQLSERLREQFQQASAEGLTPDQAYAKAEDFASMYMMNLHRSYVRKATRLGTFADAKRTPAGDLISPQGALIPAARDPNGELTWVDRTTGQRVPAGTPDAMTVPERGSYHLGHKYGYENWRVLRQAAEEGWTQGELNDFMNRHGLYDVSSPADNLSHRYEDSSPYAPNPEWTPERLRNVLPTPEAVPGTAAPAGAPQAPVSSQVPTPSAVPSPGAASAPLVSPPPDLTLPPHPAISLPPFLQPAIPPGYAAGQAPVDPSLNWLPMDTGGVSAPAAPTTPAPAAPSSGFSLPTPDISLPPPPTPDQAAAGTAAVGGVALLLLIGALCLV
ncbi:GH-E family nuclease [Mycobacterium sp. MYCO198283]|uniref:GH-E family nuclease n=1 Tax=Mycobacterium sp. MYCO198283 TaxID=2883505 RepID=UPI001E2D64B0|nr:GH-E family nuclease [Mycobacterium sp. MYCO198283]MCG5430897.1 GH-E family nuclease [Mycobacterium sp. MYCO198283]